MKRSRFFVLVAVTLLVAGVFSVRLMRYQLVEGATYRKQSENTTQSVGQINAPRGEIVDRYGRRIATNKVGYDVVFSWAYFPKQKNDADYENSVILKLTQVLTEDGETWNNSLPISGQPYQYAADAQTVKKFQTWLQKNYKAPASADAKTAMAQLCKSFGISDSYSDAQKLTIAGIRYEMTQQQFSAVNSTFNFASDVGLRTVTKILERNSDFPGVEINEDPIRIYPDGTLAPHLVGTVGPMYAEDYAALKNKGYSMDDTIGRSGLEKSMEKYLKGTNGSKGVELNSSGKIISESVENNPKPGDTVVLSIDSKLQTVLQNSLKSTIQSVIAQSGGSYKYGSGANAGSAVVISVKTGEVLAAASYPTYNINDYLKDYSQLLKQPGNPLLDRAVAGIYRPGSTFKPCVAVSALMNGAISNNTYFDCDGVLYRYSHAFHCDAAHGSLNVIGAIQESCNYFFYNAGDRDGIKNIDNTAGFLGLGSRTGIEIGGEKKGVLAGPAEREAAGGTWYPGDTLQASIGQSDNLFTPLQLANYIATIVNGGTRYKVHIVDKVVSYDDSKTIVDNTTPQIVSKLNIPGSIVSTVKQGMHDVTEDNGTAAAAFRNFPLAVGGKTGTAEVPGGYNSVFVAFAPYDDPQIAVAAVVEHGYHGNEIAPIAVDAFNTYFFSTSSATGVPGDNSLLK